MQTRSVSRARYARLAPVTALQGVFSGARRGTAKPRPRDGEVTRKAKRGGQAVRSPNAFLWIWIGLVLIGLLVLVYAKYAATTDQDTASTESRTETPEVDPPKTDPLRKDPAAEDPTAVDPSVSAPLVPVTPAPVDPRPLVVIEATRAPARDARVALVARGEAQWRTTAGVSVRVIPERVLWEAVTDAEGRIPWPPEGDVPPGSYALRVTQKGYAPATRAVTLPAERFEEPIVLTHGGTLTATGLPDAGIPVLASSREGALYHAPAVAFSAGR